MDTITQPKDFPPGDYCIVELFGHSTLVGRFAEIERFGTKMLAIEPLFKGEMLPVVYHGGAAIYRLTPCSAQIAWDRQPQESYQIPPSIAAIAPAALLERTSVNATDDRGGPFDDDGDGPF